MIEFALYLQKPFALNWSITHLYAWYLVLLTTHQKRIVHGFGTGYWLLNESLLQNNWYPASYPVMFHLIKPWMYLQNGCFLLILHLKRNVNLIDYLTEID